MHTNNKRLIRILLIEGHLLVRTALRVLLETRPGLVVVGDAGTRADALAIASREKPDIILLDLDRADAGGDLDLIAKLLSIANDARVLLLTGLQDEEIHQRAVGVGAMGLVLKDRAADELFRAVEKVNAGEVWLDRSLMAQILSRMVHNGADNKMKPEVDKTAVLTEREREVTALLSEGLKNKAIAERLFISETTVRHHLTSVFKKLDVSSRFELILLHQQELAKAAKTNLIYIKRPQAVEGPVSAVPSPSLRPPSSPKAKKAVASKFDV